MRRHRDLPLIALGAALAALAVACGSPEPAPEAALRGGPFECGDRGCTQERPAYPDDGEWECTDVSGVVLCLGGIAAAGVRPGPSDDAFVCGPRPRDEHGRRVCLDARPDVPDGRIDRWTCRFDRDGGREVRRCEPAIDRAGVGAPCGTCPEGLACGGGRCAVASTGPPDCWLDEDCDGARCVLGHCGAP